MSEKICPVCGNLIKDATQPCPSCGNLTSPSSAGEEAVSATLGKKNGLSRIPQIIMLGIFIIFALIVVYKFCGFLFGGGVIRNEIIATFGKLIGLVVWMLKKVFLATIIYLFPPIIMYCVVNSVTKNIFTNRIANILVRAIAGVGSIYIFYLLSGDVTLSLKGALEAVKLAFQIYLLVILVMPQEFMMILGTIASVIGSIVIFIFPDLPGAFDDMAAICTLITIIFVYLNTLALFIKRFTGKFF
jgi:hypothetical protein